jgi:hypothetical protein
MSTSFARALALAAIIGSGCTSLFALDDVTSDRDRDRVANEHDVCPDDYDPAQADQDGDGIGDACDECRSLTHDIDADGRDDGCDACIGTGPTGDDSDDDGIDDGCDPCVGGVSSVTTDLDADGVPDGCDACIANGLDRDRDGIDDACDVCLFGPPHDEDGDGVFDACDVCPADPDPGQEMSSDKVGAVCDPDPNVANVRRLFDSFATDDSSVWLPDADWTIVDDAIVPPKTGEVFRFAFPRVRGAFSVRTHIHFNVSSTKSTLGLEGYANVGIRVEQPRCMISSDGVVSNVLGESATTVDVSGGVELVLRRVAGNDDLTTECIAIDTNGARAMVTESSVGFDLRLRLYANVGLGGFDWLDAVDQPPE